MGETRSTEQRKRILAYLKSVKTHPTAEAVYRAVRKDMPNITLATVYRNLNLLAEQGHILRLEINKEYHYDADTSLHQHCVCTCCGKVIDNYTPAISRYVLNKIGSEEFTPDSTEIFIYGKCRRCREVNDNGKSDDSKGK